MDAGCAPGLQRPVATGSTLSGSARSQASLTSVAGCNGCDLKATLTTPYTAYAAPTTNPFAYLDTKV